MSAPPPRGARAGVKQDVQAAKAARPGYDNGPATTPWSHDFLNKKPWHPANFRNQLRKWEAEQEVVARQKREDAAAAEFDAEQRYLDTLAALPSAAADKYRARQQVSWMYVKPPGMAAAEEAQAKRGERDCESEGPAAQHRQRAGAAPGAADRSVGGIGGARSAGVGNTGSALTFNVAKRKRSPPRGGYSADDANQQFLGDDEGWEADEGTVGGGAGGVEACADGGVPRHKHKSKDNDKDKPKKKKRKKEKGDKHDEKKLKKALELLVEEGYNVEDLLAKKRPGREPR